MYTCVHASMLLFICQCMYACMVCVMCVVCVNMHVCMCTQMRVCVRACVCVCVCAYACACACMGVCVHVCLYVYLFCNELYWHETFELYAFADFINIVMCYKLNYTFEMFIIYNLFKVNKKY